MTPMEQINAKGAELAAEIFKMIVEKNTSRPVGLTAALMVAAMVLAEDASCPEEVAIGSCQRLVELWKEYKGRQGPIIVP